MKRFSYKAREKDSGKMVNGDIQAENERTAGKLLIDQGYLPLTVKEAGDENFLANMMGRITTKDKLVFTRQFATLIGAGLPLSNSLRLIIEQTSNKKLKGIEEEILAAVESGKSLSEACAAHPEMFDKVYLALLGAGEMSGTLDESLKRLAMQQEKDAQMMSKIKGALTYPTIVLLVIAGVVGFMVLAVVPQVEKLYIDLKQPLPVATAIMVALAHALINYWWLMLGVIIALVVGIRTFLKTKTGEEVSATIKLNMPMFNELFKRLYMARFARTSQILLSTGVPMLEVMRISGEAMNNVVLQKQITAAAEQIKGGKAMSDSLKGRDYVMPFLPQMISIGEESGKIDEMLGKVAQVYEEELDEKIKAISTMIEPALMVVMAVVAGGVVGAVLIPIYGLVNKLT